MVSAIFQQVITEHQRFIGRSAIGMNGYLTALFNPELFLDPHRCRWHLVLVSAAIKDQVDVLSFRLCI